MNTHITLVASLLAWKKTPVVLPRPFDTTENDRMQLTLSEYSYSFTNSFYGSLLNLETGGADE
jgi:hypothetical protein